MSIMHNASKVVGMPDSQDEKNIRILINAFNNMELYCPYHKKDHKGINACYVQAARDEMRSMTTTSKYGEKSKDMELRHVVTMSPAFAHMLEQGYPTFFTDTKHTLWFARHFPEFRVPDKI